MAQRKQSKQERLAELASHEAWLQEQEQALQEDEANLARLEALHHEMLRGQQTLAQERVVLRREVDALIGEHGELAQCLEAEAAQHSTVKSGTMAVRPETYRALTRIYDESQTPSEQLLRTSYEGDAEVYLRIEDAQSGALRMEQYVPLSLLLTH